MVVVRDFTVMIDGKKIITGLSCLLPPKRITLLLGKSGAGKTTLLKSLAGLVQPCDGSVMINDQQVECLLPQKRAEEIGYVFQDFNLFPHLTVLQNCADPLLIRGVAQDVAEQIAQGTLAQLGMDPFVRKYPEQLSGGQRQRVTIARALCLHPKVLLLDEPTASLDPENTDVLVTLLQELAKKGLVIGLSTQDMLFAKKIFDRAYYLEDGKIVEQCDDVDLCDSGGVVARWLE